MNKIKINLLLVVTLILFVPCLVFALPSVHNPSAANGYVCNSCHVATSTFGNAEVEYASNVCLVCHLSGDSGKTKKLFKPEDFSNPYGNVNKAVLPVGGTLQTSHKWFGGEVVPAAGAIAPVDASSTGLNKTAIKGTLSCARCHNVHANAGLQSVTSPFLRYPNNQDQMCLNCHRPRDTKDHTVGTHPVNVSYTSARMKARIAANEFLAVPVTNSTNRTGQVKLVNNSVVCSTCHGLHNTDSDSATFDAYTTGHLPNNSLSASKGYLLRVSPRGVTANAVNVCTNCHAGKVAHNGNSQNIQCNDCHGGHVEYDAFAPAELKNVYLIRRFNTYSAPGGGFDNKRVLFRYTSASKREYYNYPAKTGVCQNCHNLTSGHFSGGVEANGLVRVACASCHKHNDPASSFKASGCDGCHGFPPVADTVGGPNGKASALYTGTESTAPHSSHASGGAGNYTFSCGQCHNGFDSAPSKHENGLYNDGVFVTKVAVSAGGVISGATAAYNGTSCSTVYCHSDGTSTTTLGAPKTVTWAGGLNAITGCAACHAASPGTGSHPTHITTMGYGCITCHAGTVTNNTTVNITGGKHVNALKDVQFSGVVPATGSDCSTVACHGNGAPVWGSAATGLCGTCHATATAGSFGTTSHATHFAVIGTGNSSCTTCHNYVGETSAPHVSGSVDLLTSSATVSCGKCHADPYSVAVATPPTWGTSATGCSACHKDAGAITASGPVTGSHAAHNVTDCSKCHTGATNSATTPSVNHADGDIDVNSGYTANVAKHVSGSYASRTCSTATCHANVYGTGSTTTPVWGSTAGCEACHSTLIAATGPATGSHAAHNVTDCSKCHTGATNSTTTPSANHADGDIDVNSGYTANVAKHVAGSYSSRTCATASCHANVYGTGSTTTPVWGATAGCEACHSAAIVASGPATGSHAVHNITDCSKCHTGATNSTTVPTVNHADGDIDVNSGYAANVAKHTTVSGYGTRSCATAVCHGSSSPSWGANTTNVLCTKCHGTGTTSAITVANRDLVAPVGGTLIGTGQVSDNVKVGAHKTHLSYLNGFSNYSSSFDYRCIGCHGTLPTTGTHADGLLTVPFSATNVSTKWNAKIPSYNGTTCSATYCHNPAGTVLNVANTGTSVTPSWTNAAYIAEGTKKTLTNCNTCHKLPGEAGFAGFNHGTVTIANDCASCHSHNGDTAGAIGKRHIDGKLFGAGDCNSCHDYDTVGATYSGGKWSAGSWGKAGTNYGAYPTTEGWGAHAKHINAIKSRLAIGIALDPTNQTYGVGNPANVCGACHTNVFGNHNMSGSTGDAAGRMINFGDSTFKIGGAAGTSFTFGTTFPAQNPVYAGVSGTSSQTTGKTCSNISCHYFTTPLWSTY